MFFCFKGHKKQKLTLFVPYEHYSTYITMKKNILLLFIFAIVLFAGKRAAAQDYRVAAGLKFSYEFGPTVKYFMDNTDALEAELGLRSHGVVFTGLWERHIPAFNVDKLKFYYGFGAHIGGVGAGTYKRFNGDNVDYTNNSILIGADGIVGLEYVVPDSPIGISLDLNPRLELGRGPYFDIAPGLGLKYTF